MAVVFVPNKSAYDDITRMDGVVEACEDVADSIVGRAKTLAPIDEGDYIGGHQADKGIEGTTGLARANANDWKSGLIEFGTSDTPTFAPLRRLLWKHLKTREMEGTKFRRQQPIGKYIIDFVFFEKKVIIEVDGGQHTEEVDKTRVQWLIKQGFRVLRFWNNDVLQNTEGVLEVIRNNCLSTLP